MCKTVCEIDLDPKRAKTFKLTVISFKNRDRGRKAGGIIKLGNVVRWRMNRAELRERRSQRQ